MPGVFNLSVDEAVQEAAAAQADGVRGVLLFGLPDHKDDIGSSAVRRRTRRCRRRSARSSARCRTCWSSPTSACASTPTTATAASSMDDEIANDPTVDQLVRAAVSHAAAGADIVAPSDMMDGRVGAIRQALDERGFEQVAIMSYAAKYCSAFYGPFRDAAGSAPQFGDRRTHQMDPANADEALREVEQDIEEGADIVMVKPALPYLDVIRRVKDTLRLSDGRVPRERRVRDAEGRRRATAGSTSARAMLETLTAIRRAGADIIITYYARDAARARSR